MTEYRRTTEPGVRKRVNRDGSVSYQIQVRMRGFPHVAETETTFRRAKARRRQIIEALKDGKYHRRGTGETLGELVDDYMASKKWAKLEEATRQHRKTRLAWWVNLAGKDLALRNLTPSMVARLADRIEAGETPSGKPVGEVTRNRYLATLSAALSWGVRMEYLEENPAIGRKVERGQEPERGYVLSDEEFWRLYEATEEFPRLRRLVLCGLSSSSREGELLRWRWEAVSLRGDHAVIRDVDRKARGKRTARVWGLALEALKEASRTPHISGLVFARPDGKSTFPRHDWEKVRKAAVLESLRFHDLRHTSISYLAALGASEAELMAHSGHLSPAMVARYTDLDEAAIQSQVKHELVSRLLRAA